MLFPLAVGAALFLMGRTWRRWALTGILLMFVFIFTIDRNTVDYTGSGRYSMTVLSWLALVLFVANLALWPLLVVASRRQRRLAPLEWTGSSSVIEAHEAPPMPADRSVVDLGEVEEPEADPTVAGPRIFVPTFVGGRRGRPVVENGVVVRDARPVDPEEL